MSTSMDSGQLGEGPALALVPGSQPWYATAAPPPIDRQALEDEHTRVLSYELVLRADDLAAQLRASRERSRTARGRGG